MAGSALPELCSCPGPDEFTYLNRELCSRPRLALLLLLVPDGGKLTPSNLEKLILHADSLAGFLVSLSGLGRKEVESWRFVHLGIFYFRVAPYNDPDRPSLSTPREHNPGLRAAGLEGIMASSSLPSAGVWGTGLEARGLGSNPISDSGFPQVELGEGQQRQPQGYGGDQWENRCEKTWLGCRHHLLIHEPFRVTRFGMNSGHSGAP